MAYQDLEEIAAKNVAKPAVIMGSGGVRTYGELLERSNRLANVLHQAGLRRGDVVALMLPNRLEFIEVGWAAHRSGLYYTPINSHLTTEEVRYILEDSGAKAVIMDASLEAVADNAGIPTSVHLRLLIGGAGPHVGYIDYEAALAAAPASGPPEPSPGSEMMYSSGTTGRPKAVLRPLPQAGSAMLQASVAETLAAYGLDPEGTYLTPAPLYHSAPLAFTMATTRLGSTAVVMERFDPERCLQLIERHRVTVAQFVPTMFVRMLKLPAEVRERYDLSSLRSAIHAAAPCPVDVKMQMIEWWGPIIYEYYAGTEGFGGTRITAPEWLLHKGSVGQALPTLHIVGPDDEDLPANQSGMVYFEGPSTVEYLNDPAKTASVQNSRGWRTFGDMGYLDDERYLYLTDRATFMIVSGGVNIYPQEAENVLVMHPKVADVAVFGVPNSEFGEEVKAVVQPVDPADSGPELQDELMRYCRSQLAAYKCPRSIDFQATLPRDENGKLYKRRLRDLYWAGHGSRVL
jgi:acyl-CoA synthetase (AMP-forming)/AMP-acid ligase II